MTSTNPYHHLYLSPHYDDASLSCGGAIFQQVQAGEAVLVITICAAEPPDPALLSPFARAMHEAWGNVEQMVARRRAEDAASMARLGCDFQRLEVLDCIYRGRPEAGEWYYTSEIGLFGEIDPADLGLADRIAQAVVDRVTLGPETRLYAPLTVGHHVDHQLAQAAARRLQGQGWTGLLYEDYPYADPHYPFTRSPLGHENAYTLAKTLASPPLADLQSQVCPLSEAALQAKIDSIAAYDSQMGGLFGNSEAMAQFVRSYARQIGQGLPAERLWRPSSSSPATK